MNHKHVSRRTVLKASVALLARRPIPVPSGIFRNAPNPNAARLFQNFLFSVDA